VCRAALEKDPEIDFLVSHTTRTPRAGEQSGVDYHFVSPAEFRRLVEAGEFLEHAQFNANNYGTSREALRMLLEDESKDALLEIEVQGAAQVRERRDDACLIFLLPPSLAVLEQRLRGRGTDDDDAIDRRLGVADRELEAIRFFDYAVVNDDLDETVGAVLEIIAAERDGSCAALRGVRALHGRERVYREWSAAQQVG
jgi:guanylate kinase